jgi:citrate synthase
LEQRVIIDVNASMFAAFLISGSGADIQSCLA